MAEEMDRRALCQKAFAVLGTPLALSMLPHSVRLAGRVLSQPTTTEGEQALDPTNIVIVTEDIALDINGCDSVTTVALQGALSSVLYRGETRVSPGRITADPDLTIIATAPNNHSRDIQLFTRQSPDDFSRWRHRTIKDSNLSPGFGAGILLQAHNHSLLVGTVERNDYSSSYNIHPPFYVRRIVLPDLESAPDTIEHVTIAAQARLLNEFGLDEMPFAFFPDEESGTVHVLAQRDFGLATGKDSTSLHTLDARTLETIAPPIRLALISGQEDPERYEGSLPIAHAALTPGDTHIITNRGVEGGLNVVGLSVKIGC